MSGYGRTLRGIQAEAATLLGRAQAAAQDKATQERSRDQVRAADPAAPTTAHEEAIAGAQSRIDGVRHRLDDLRDRRRAAERTAIAKLEQASDEGIANDPWWKRAWDAVDRWVDEHADLLKKISAALSFVAGILAVIPGLQGLALVVGGLALLTNLALAATGNGSWKTLLIDAALTVVGAGLGKLAVAGFKALKSARATRQVARANSLKRCLGDPIDVATGEMVMDHVDGSLPGALPLTISRSHISSYRAGRWFGPSWASTFDQRIELDGDWAWLSAADGMLLLYTVPADAVAVLPEEGPRWPLARTVEGGWTVTDPERGHTRHFPAPDGDGISPLATLTDRNGHRTDLVRAADGTPTEIRHSGGYRIVVDTAAGRVTALRLAGGTEAEDLTLVRYGYDAFGRLTKVFNSSGRPMTFTYDRAGRVTGWEDRNGWWYRYAYDDEGRCVRTEGSGGCLDATFAYDADRCRTVVTNSLGHDTTFVLNRLLQVVREVDPLGGEVRSDWNRDDQLLARTDQLGRTTTYDYDGSHLVRVTRPDGSRLTAEYGDLGLPTRIVEPDGAEWRPAHDGRGNLTAMVDPAGATTTYEYDDRGHLARVTDALGLSRRVEADGAGLTVAITDPHGATTSYQRDALGQVAAITDPAGGVTTLAWTVEGKLVRRTLPDGATERWSYDGEGNLVEHVDAAGGVTRTEIAPFDLPAAETGPDGARTTFAYDTELTLVAVTNPQGLVWRYEHDAAGNLAAETDFNGRRLEYVHDAAGQLVERITASGRRTTFRRDVLGRVVEQRGDGSASPVTFDYDPQGRIVGAANGDARLAFQRDALGRVLAESCNGLTVHSQYDALGRRTRRRTPTGAESAWAYDVDHQPLALRTAGRTVELSYDRARREVARVTSGTTVSSEWDANHRLRAQTVTHGSGTVQKRSYTYRADGYPTAVEDLLGGARRLDLDVLGRVTGVQGSAGTETYVYDAAGSPVWASWPTEGAAAAVTADAAGEREYAGTMVRRAGAVRYDYDGEGRVVLRQQRRPSAKPRSWHYTWDDDDRLAAVSTPDGRRWRYLYDPLGRRIAKHRLGPDGATTEEEVRFVWDGTVLAEQASAGRATVWNWDPGTFRPATQTERSTGGDGAQEWYDERFFTIVTDLVGTPTELVDEAGTVAWRPRRTLWGTIVAHGDDGASCPLGFPGQYFDSETGAYYNFHRYYDPTISRYLSADPLGLTLGPDPHAYVPNPTGWTDPLGLGNCAGARYTAKSARKNYVEGHAANSPRKPGKGRFRVGEGGQKFTDEVINHPNVVKTPQPRDGRMRYEVYDLGRDVGWDRKGYPVRGGRVVVESPNPSGTSPWQWEPGEVVTQFAQY